LRFHLATYSRKVMKLLLALALVLACSKPSPPSAPPDPTKFVGMWQATWTIKLSTCDSMKSKVGDVRTFSFQLITEGGKLQAVFDGMRDDVDTVEGPTFEGNAQRVVLLSHDTKGTYSERSDLVGDDRALAGTMLVGISKGGPIYEPRMAKMIAGDDMTWSGPCAIYATITAVKK